jgi:hypothetical protein
MASGWSGIVDSVRGAEWVSVVPTTQPSGHPGLDEVNGYARFRTFPDANRNILSWTDPYAIAHEFFHSFSWDYTHKAGVNTVSSVDFDELDEGMADCFAMIFTKTHLSEMNDMPALPHPFHLGSGLYTDANKGTLGLVNLVNPRNSESEEFTTWAGDRAIASDRDEHTNSTLMSGVCKLLITGGGITDPEITPHINVSGHLNTIALGFTPVSGNAGTNNEELGYERLTDLLLHTVQSGALDPSRQWLDFIEAFATQADRLAAQWGAPQGNFDERLRTASGAYGFGRTVESEAAGTQASNNNRGVNVGTNEAIAAKNVIAVGKNNRRHIKGRACCDDEDFFVLNEKVRQGDKITVSVTGSQGAGKFRIRIYEKQIVSNAGPGPSECTFYSNAAFQACEASFQEYPPVNANGKTNPNLETATGTMPPQSFTYERTGGTTEAYYVGIAPAINSNGGNYELSVHIERKAPAPY